MCWAAGDLSYMLWPQQQIIYDSIWSLPPHVALAVILCARQFGKSFLEAVLAIEKAIRNPDRCMLIIGPTEKQTREIVAPKIKMIAKDAPLLRYPLSKKTYPLVRRSKSEGKWCVGPKDCESEIFIGGFDQNSTAQRGKTLLDIFIEEVVDSDPDTFNESMRSDLGPALTHSKGGKMIFVSTLPKIPDHPFITEKIPEAKLDGAFYSYTIDDNAALTLDEKLKCAKTAGCKVDREKKLILVKTPDYLREYENQQIRDEQKTIIPAFDEKRHVVDFALPTYSKFWVYGDWGGVKDKTALLLVTYDYLRNKVLFIDERFFDPNTATNQIMRTSKVMECQVDADAFGGRKLDAPGQTLVDIRELGFDVEQVHKGDWLATVQNLNIGFQLDSIEVHPRCRYLIQTLNSGQLNKQRTDFARSEVLGHADMVAAAMYAYRNLDRTNPWPKPESSTIIKRPTAEDLDRLEREKELFSPQQGQKMKARKFGAFAK